MKPGAKGRSWLRYLVSCSRWRRRGRFTGCLCGRLVWPHRAHCCSCGGSWKHRRGGGVDILAMPLDSVPLSALMAASADCPDPGISEGLAALLTRIYQDERRMP